MALLEYNTSYRVTKDQIQEFQAMHDALAIFSSKKAQALGEDGDYTYAEIATVIDPVGNGNGRLTGDDFASILLNANRFQGDAKKAVEVILSKIRKQAASQTEIDSF